jgi:predicted kinase
MISLIKILLESTQKPKAIFLAGPAGSGKSFITKQLIPASYNVINSDDTYEAMLKASGMGLSQKNFSPEQLSQAAKMQAQARKITDQRLQDAMDSRKNIVIDGTAASVNPILKKKQQLEELGYETLMLMIYVSPLLSLERNKNRERSLMPSIVLRTWRDVNKNIPAYENAFENFILLNNNLKDTDVSFSQEKIQPYLDDSKAVGKVKSEKDQAKSDEEKREIMTDISNLVKSFPNFITLDQAKTKINKFING